MLATDDALPLEVTGGGGIVTYFRFRNNLLLPMSFDRAILSFRLGFTQKLQTESNKVFTLGRKVNTRNKIPTAILMFSGPSCSVVYF